MRCAGAANPENRFLNTSNENLVNEEYPHRNAISWNWDDPYRGNRVREELKSGRIFNLQDMAELQHDVLSIPARTVVPLLNNLVHPDEEVNRAREKLLKWDFIMEPGSVAAGIYMEWEREFRERVSRLFIPDEVYEWIGWLQIKPAIDRLLSPDGKFGNDPLSGRNRLLLESLEAAVSNLSKRFGADMDQWQYGRPGYKHVHLRHPMSDAVNGELRELIEVGPAPRGGYRYTVNNTAYEDNQTHGGTFRIIVDTGNFDRTLATTAPGQSGDPETPYYDNLFQEWADGRYFPLFYSRDKIETVTRETFHLKPGK
jgi:penicillin amidase